MTQSGDHISRRARDRIRRWRPWLSRWFGLLGFGLTVAGALPVAAQSAAVPQHWISYAQLTGNQFQAWLSDPASETVVRLHAALEGRPEPLPGVVARVWVAADGRVERLEFASLGNALADADLRAVLTAQPLSEPPPPDMRQPMVLELTLSTAEPI